MTHPWTDSHIASLRKLWPDHSAMMIAERFGDRFTKNSIIGMAHRLNLPIKQRGFNARHGANAKRKRDSHGRVR